MSMFLKKGTPEKTTIRQVTALTLLVMATFFWGVTFVIVKEAVAQAPVFVFLTQRFVLSFLLLGLICILFGRRLSAYELRNGALLGIFLFGGFGFQTMALTYTSASNTAFLTGMNVVLVPLVSAVAFRHAVTVKMRTGVLLATAGLYFLCGGGDYQWNTGDILGLLCALCYALHIVLTGRYAMQSDVYWLTAIELGMVGLLSLVFAKAEGHAILVRYDGMVNALVICVLFATIFAFLAQTAMQRHVTPTQTALIFCMEPVFAAASAYLMLDEKLGMMGLAGALLILAGMILSQLPDRKRA